MTHIPAVHVRQESRHGGAVAFVTLDNAPKLNVLNTPLMDAIAAGIDAFAASFETDEPAIAMAKWREGRR